MTRATYRLVQCASALMALGVFSAGHAHHSHSSLDRNNIQQHRGVVTRFAWRMPHVFMQVDAVNSDGELVTYTIELLNPPSLMQFGWSKDSFKPGDVITWSGAADKNPERYYSGLTWVEKADGTRLIIELGNAPVDDVSPSTDMTGVWVRDNARVGFTYFPPKNWPYTEKGERLVAAFSESQNPQLDCENPGPPKSTLLPYPIKISRPDADTVVVEYDSRDQRRVFKLGQDEVAGEPSVIGQSRAWMESDELVVVTDNFVADRWGNHTGVDSSAQKTLVERYSLIDQGLTLRIRMTLTDPVYLTEPVEIDYYMKKQADRSLSPDSCTLESARLFLEAGYE